MAIDPTELQQHLKDYETFSGQPCPQFVCPITLRSGGELINGHVIPEAVKSVSRAKVIQRKDTDGYFGQTIEPDMINMLNVESAHTFKDFLDMADQDKLFGIDESTGNEWKLFKPSGDPKGRFAVVELRDEKGETYESFCVKGDKGEVSHLQFLTVDSYVTFWNPAIIGSFIKAAYLSAFRMIGYRFLKGGLSGEFIRQKLSEFVLSCQTRKDAADTFFSFRGSVRMLQTDGPDTLGDTLTKNLTLLHFHRDMLFGETFLFRISGKLYAVTVPADAGDGREFTKAFPLYRKWLDDPNSLDVQTHKLQGKKWLLESTPMEIENPA